MAFWKRNTKDEHTFSDLVRGLQHSISAAMEMIESRNIEMLDRYFDTEGKPVSKQLIINDDTVLDVPLISIVTPSSLNIKEVDLEFSVNINQTDLKKREPKTELLNNENHKFYPERVERSSLHVSFGGGKKASTMNVKIKFEAVPVPEGVSRVITEYDKTIQPTKG